jgi:DNA-binding NarL/FixJ family response regulator
MNTQHTKLLVVDDHPLMLDSLAQLAGQALPHAAVLTASSYAQARRLVGGAASPDMVLLDPGLPDVSGSLAIQGMVHALGLGSVIVVSASDQMQDQEAAWAAGAHSFISKAADPAVLMAGLQAVAQGQRVLICRQNVVAVPSAHSSASSGLSARQLQVLCAMCAGHSNKVIARQLQIAEKTVKAHLSAIFEKLDVSSRTQAALVARRLCLVNDAPEDNPTAPLPLVSMDD